MYIDASAAGVGFVGLVVVMRRVCVGSDIAASDVEIPLCDKFRGDGSIFWVTVESDGSGSILRSVDWVCN